MIELNVQTMYTPTRSNALYFRQEVVVPYNLVIFFLQFNSPPSEEIFILDVIQIVFRVNHSPKPFWVL